MYSLKRVSDGIGDSGPVSTLMWEENGEVKYENQARPRVGTCIQVGSLTARTMQYQDYWQTSHITEIIEDTENMVKFKTLNSEYIWRIIL